MDCLIILCLRIIDTYFLCSPNTIDLIILIKERVKYEIPEFGKISLKTKKLVAPKSTYPFGFLVKEGLTFKKLCDDYFLELLKQRDLPISNMTHRVYCYKCKSLNICGKCETCDKVVCQKCRFTCSNKKVCIAKTHIFCNDYDCIDPIYKILCNKCVYE